MVNALWPLVWLSVTFLPLECFALQSSLPPCRRHARGDGTLLHATPKEQDNKAMAFLKKIGRVGGDNNRDFRFSIGVDEGPSGMAEAPEIISSGTRWSGVTGGSSSAALVRDTSFHGRTANVLRGHVSLDGFVQMATSLSKDPSQSKTVDASSYDGVELDVFCESESGSAESFNVHLEDDACTMSMTAFRASFLAPDRRWATLRIPWTDFAYHAGESPRAETSINVASLSRAAIVAIGRPITRLCLGIARFRFYKNSDSEPHP